MNKPNSLKDHLMAAVPMLKHNEDRMLCFINKGTVRCTLASTLSYEYNYELQLILTEFPGHPDSVFLPLLAWLRVNQSELLANLDDSEKGLKFEIDIIDRHKVSMAISLPLTERVVVSKKADGSYDLSHPPEPQYTEQIAVEGEIKVYADGQLLASWPAAQPTETVLLESPIPGRRNG